MLLLRKFAAQSLINNGHYNLQTTLLVFLYNEPPFFYSLKAVTQMCVHICEYRDKPLYTKVYSHTNTLIHTQLIYRIRLNGRCMAETN